MTKNTYWTAFCYERIDPNALHCTHKYLGKQGSAEVRFIERFIELYFLNEPFQEFTVQFEAEDFFGKEGEIRALQPSLETPLKSFYLELRGILDEFQADTYQEGYRPHVTSKTPLLIKKPFTRYCLMQGHKIIREWR